MPLVAALIGRGGRKGTERWSRMDVASLAGDRFAWWVKCSRDFVFAGPLAKVDIYT